jgi:hypothetical protein
MHYGGHGYGSQFGGGNGYSPYRTPYGTSLVVNHDSCVGGCPNQAFCDYAICRCREGYEARFGQCFENFGSVYNSER